ncbi:ubiquitin carboxyl-terminal hydrolase 10-like [Saccostrea echinata]|uniref:ubiquitin carboxyl-terminal hydrolase 10-like n=1 Tax=Saccostrea echinata TaxID=191078 RepID=UPI002A816637|nr:ubiquitin carboxyl-terminal hydrolase 10-like [Saccostrea echinata]
MNPNVQGLNFLDVTSLDPQEQQRVNDILFGQRSRVLGKVEFPWGNLEPRRFGEGDVDCHTQPNVSAQGLSDSSVHHTEKHPEQAISSNATDKIVCNSEKAFEVENFYINNAKTKEQSTNRNAGKPYERRNKKRRPPDYYQRFEEAAHVENSILTGSQEESRPLMWHEEVEQSLPLLDNQVDSFPATGNFSSQGNSYLEQRGVHSSNSAQTDHYPQHQNFGANFQGNVTIDNLISKQPEFIPPSRSSEEICSHSSNFSQWQQPVLTSADTYNSSSKQSAPISQFNVSGFDSASFTKVSPSMHHSGPSHETTNFVSTPSVMSHGVSYAGGSTEISSTNASFQTESQNIEKLSEHISMVSVQHPAQNVTPNTCSNSNLALDGSGKNSSMIQESSVDSFSSCIPPVSSQHLIDQESKDNVDSADQPLTFDFDQPRTDLDPDQYPVLGKTSGPFSEESPRDSAEGLSVQSTSPQSVPPQAVKPKSASWAGLFSNVDPARQGFVVTTSWASTPTTDTPKPAETPKTESKLPCAPVDVSEDPLAKTFGDSLSRMKVNHVPIGLQPRGLMNRGNWCYINATLQALVSCPPFYNVMKKFPIHPPVRRGKSCTPILDSIVQFVHEFHPCGRPTERGKRTLTDLTPGPAFEPTNVYNMLQVIEANKSFKLGKQEDAEEFLSCILDGLHEEMSTLIKFANGTSTASAASNGSVAEDVVVDESSEDAGSDSWEQVGPKKKSVLTRRATFEKTPLAEIFVGYTRSALYKASSKDSATLQPFFTLQLDIQSDKVYSVKEALEGLVSRESVSGFTCSKTKAEVDVVRHLTLEELPPVLILHLKFFVYDKDGGSQKLLKNLEYGIDLEITKDLLSPNVRNKLQIHQRSYKLFAVVYHHGKKATGGHYTTAVFHPAINNWIMIDDSLVKHVSVGSVLKTVPGRVPYLLYYRRIDMH